MIVHDQKCALLDFYKYGLMEMVHELGNVIQKMICISYEMETNGIDAAKLNSRINAMTQMIKIYTGIYTASTYSFQEMIEMIEIFHNCPIELTGNFTGLDDGNEKEFVNLSRILVIYAMWISKRHELTINVLNNQEAELYISSNGGAELRSTYSLEANEEAPIYARILRNFSQFGFKGQFTDGYLRVTIGE